MSYGLALDVDRIRREALQTMSAGPATTRYGLDTERVVSVLNDVVAAEVVGWLRYTRHAGSAERVDRSVVSELFTRHAEREMSHAVATAERIGELGGQPNFDPATLAQRAHTDYAAPDDGELRAMLEQNLLAARIVVSTYQEIARWLGDRDPTTRRLVESVLEEEEQNAHALAELLDA
ncbi:ferritin-like domain-containing protein [Kitasatospora sp. NPDC056138]|uniref:ferritin-like domain-containing protein n=1 Tax=Kitasatospora sp. NPDC056138 TaxID=3345724 RepID=UPI0035DE6E27